MAGTQISTSVTIISSLLGYQAISLTNMDSISAPDIAAGSKVEIKSAFFTFAAATTPQATTWTAIGTGSTAYITLTPSGSAGSQVCTAMWSGTAPTWSESAQGWYASTASSVRYVASCQKRGAVVYDKKAVMAPCEISPSVVQSYTATGTGVSTYQKISRVYEIGEWDMSTTTSILIQDIVAGISAIQNATAWIMNDAGVRFFDLLVGDGTSAGVGNITGWIEWSGNGWLEIGRVANEFFTQGTFDGTISTVINRGYVFVEYLTAI
jgi:hypothetical protein